MLIKFPKLLQDSWNFIRNNLNFTLSGILLIALLQIANSFLFPRGLLTMEEVQSPQAVEKLLTMQISPMLVNLLITSFTSIILILNIKAINNGTYRHFFQPSNVAFKALFPVILLVFIWVMPISFGAAFAISPQLQSMAIIGLPLMITGLFIFVKLNLIVFAYLFEEKSVGETLKFTWAMSRGRMLPLILFCVICFIGSSILVGLVGTAFMALGEMGNVINQIFAAFISLFITVFSFRFYQVYRGK